CPAVRHLLVKTVTGMSAVHSKVICAGVFRITGAGISPRTTKFKVGDHVRWHSEAEHVTGQLIQAHKQDVDHKGHTHRASADAPQYEIKSDKTDHVAMHKGSALRKIE